MNKIRLLRDCLIDMVRDWLLTVYWFKSKFKIKKKWTKSLLVVISRLWNKPKCSLQQNAQFARRLASRRLWYWGRVRIQNFVMLARIVNVVIWRSRMSMSSNLKIRTCMRFTPVYSTRYNWLILEIGFSVKERRGKSLLETSLKSEIENLYSTIWEFC